MSTTTSINVQATASGFQNIAAQANQASQQIKAAMTKIAPAGGPGNLGASRNAVFAASTLAQQQANAAAANAKAGFGLQLKIIQSLTTAYAKLNAQLAAAVSHTARLVQVSQGLPSRAPGIGPGGSGGGRGGRGGSGGGGFLTSATPGLGGFVGGLSIVTLVKQGQAVLETEKAYQKLERTLAVAVGPSKVASELEYAKKTAETLGLETLTLSGSYAKLSAAATLSGSSAADVKRVFEGVAAASAAVGLSADETAGAFKAVEQIFSKGKVSAEELRGQLGERLPGAFGIFAKSMGVSTAELNKLLDAGEVGVETMAKFGDELKKTFGGSVNTNGLSAQLNRLESAKNEAQLNLSRGGFTDVIGGIVAAIKDGLATFAKADLTAVFQPLKDNMAKVAGVAIGVGATAFVAAMEAATLVVLSFVSGPMAAVAAPMAAFAIALGSIVASLASTKEGMEFMIATVRDAAAEISQTFGDVFEGSGNDMRGAFREIVSVLKGIVQQSILAVAAVADFTKAITATTGAITPISDTLTGVISVFRIAADTAATIFSVLFTAFKNLVNLFVEGGKALKTAFLAIIPGSGVSGDDARTAAKAFVAKGNELDDRVTTQTKQILDSFVDRLKQSVDLLTGANLLDAADAKGAADIEKTKAKLTADAIERAIAKAQSEGRAAITEGKFIGATQDAEGVWRSPTVRKAYDDQAAVMNAYTDQLRKEEAALRQVALAEAVKQIQKQQEREAKISGFREGFISRFVTKDFEAKREKQLEDNAASVGVSDFYQKAKADASSKFAISESARTALANFTSMIPSRLLPKGVERFTEGFGQGRFQRIADLGRSRNEERMKAQQDKMESYAQKTAKASEDSAGFLREMKGYLEKLNLEAAEAF